jgi:anti-sigma factor RsiW
MNGTPVSGHLGPELQLFLDGRLDPERRARVEAHLGQCRRCERELEALRWLKQTVRDAPGTAPPAGLGARVAAALDAEDRRAREGVDLAASQSRRRLVLAGTALAAVAVLSVLLSRSRRPAALPALVSADFASYAGGGLRLEFESGDAASVEAFFRSRGIRFPTRVFDLGMMGYRLLGGRVHRLAGGPSALFAYRGPNDRDMICQMFLGRTVELPAASQVLDRNGIRFYVYREGGTTLVFWREGEVVCVLASDGDADEVIQLAFAKAMLRVNPAT